MEVRQSQARLSVGEASGPAGGAGGAGTAGELREHLRGLAASYQSELPLIFRKRRAPEAGTANLKSVKLRVVDWGSLRKGTPAERRARAAAAKGKNAPEKRYVAKITQGRTPGAGKGAGGKLYTSKYRGVHQTFPTQRWEAQFRKAGKPTSLGCFNTEDEAARAYDTMMVWEMIHQPDAKNPEKMITNFPLGDYEGKLKDLQGMQQEELLLGLRRCGRKQAAGHKVSDKNSHPILNFMENDNSDEGRIREDIGSGDKDPTCRQMYDRLKKEAPEFLPQKARGGGTYLLGTLKMQRQALVTAYVKWLDSRGGRPKRKAVPVAAAKKAKGKVRKVAKVAKVAKFPGIGEAEKFAEALAAAASGGLAKAEEPPKAPEKGEPEAPAAAVPAEPDPEAAAAA